MSCRPLLLALLLASPAFAQEQPPQQQLPPNDEKTHLFRGLFHFHKIEPEAIENIRQGYDYSKLIVVVSGDPKQQAVVNVCRATLANGGAVLIAADTDMKLSAYFPRGGEVSITGHQVIHSELGRVDGNNVVRPYASATLVNGTSPFAGLQKVATYQPSYVLSPRPPADVPLLPVASFPPGAGVMVGGFNQPALGVLPLPFALATTTDRGPRCLVVADPDVFSNRMIYTSGREQNPTDNLKLANASVQWLKGSGRTRCLFVENGEVKSKFDEVQYAAIPTGMPQPPPPPVPNIDLTDPELQRQLSNFVNEKVDEAQKNDVMNRGLLAAFGGHLPWLVTALAVVLLSVAYLLFRWKALGDRFKRLFRPIPRDPAMLGPDVPVGSLEHRRLELLRSADYGPVVRPVVLRLFQDRGLPAEYTGDKLPPLDIDVRRPQFLREAIHSLWAVVRTTAPIGFGRWKQLEPLLAAARAAADDDRWRFVAPSPRDAAS